MLKEITTKSGFDCKIEENVFDDMEVVDLLADVDDDNIVACSKLIKKILSAEDKKRLYDHIRDADGRVPVERFGSELADIMAAMTETDAKK